MLALETGVWVLLGAGVFVALGLAVALLLGLAGLPVDTARRAALRAADVDTHEGVELPPAVPRADAAQAAAETEERRQE